MPHNQFEDPRGENKEELEETAPPSDETSPAGFLDVFNKTMDMITDATRNSMRIWTESNKAAWGASILAMRSWAKQMELNAKAGEVGQKMTEEMARKGFVEFDPTMVTAWCNMFEAYTNAAGKGYADVIDGMAADMKRITEKATTGDWEGIGDIYEELANAITIALIENPRSLDAIRDKTGFHVEREEEYTLLHETPRAKIWKIHPLEEGVVTDDSRKPVLLVSPFMLDDHIMAIQPYDGISFAHQFANDGIPTYVIRFENPKEDETVATMTGEDFVSDLKDAADAISRAHHGQQIALKAVCQGAYLSLLALSSGKLDGVIDHFTQIVPPNGQPNDPGVQESLNKLPRSAHDAFPKIGSFETAAATASMKLANKENPLSDTLKEIADARKNGKPVDGLMAALSVWLDSWRERTMPGEMVRLTHEGAMTPTLDDGTLPQTLFGEHPNMAHLSDILKEWQIFTGEKDTVVSPGSAASPTTHPAFRDREDLFKLVVNKGGHISFLTGVTTEKGRAREPQNPLSLHKDFEQREGGIK